MNGVPSERKAAIAAGQPDPFTAAISGSAPSYTAQCLAMKAAGVKYSFVSHAAAIVDRVINDCAAQNYYPVWVTPQFATSFLSNSNLGKGNFVSITAVAPYTGPLAKTFRGAVAKYAPGIASQPTFGTYSYQAWLSGELLRKALEKARPTGRTITRADVFKGMYALRNETLGGQTPPLTFKKGSAPNNKCFFIATIKNGKYVQKGHSQCVK